MNRWCFLAVWLGGCAHLAPYERAPLMTRIMQDPYDEREAGAVAHVIEVREAMGGATTGSGASCGCR
ncbi:hypothetical protein LBMAG42_11010 [Deltaproteobacteria bacterium]|nr:hypothetical protein LBMAG42_11010 [Deltaproteobacteria bacterium]